MVTRNPAYRKEKDDDIDATLLERIPEVEETQTLHVDVLDPLAVKDVLEGVRREVEQVVEQQLAQAQETMGRIVEHAMRQIQDANAEMDRLRQLNRELAEKNDRYEKKVRLLEDIKARLGNEA